MFNYVILFYDELEKDYVYLESFRFYVSALAFYNQLKNHGFDCYICKVMCRNDK